jgi:hypothetical protein
MGADHIHNITSYTYTKQHNNMLPYLIMIYDQEFIKNMVHIITN